MNVSSRKSSSKWHTFEGMSAVRGKNDEWIITSLEHVVQSLTCINMGKATRPDGVPAKVFEYYGEQLEYSTNFSRIHLIKK